MGSVYDDNDCCEYCYAPRNCPGCAELATLRAQIEKLTKERDDANGGWNRCYTRYVELKKRLGIKGDIRLLDLQEPEDPARAARPGKKGAGKG